MMNNFTPRAQQVLALARKEADRFNHNYVGTEHLLLGLIKLGQGVAVNVLQKMGLDFDHLDSGCCGMAGAFGFERKHYDISMRIGERALLPRVRESSPDTLIIADGFSCREQIEQATGRKALHLAEVLQMSSRA